MKQMLKSSFGVLQKIGKALMLPVSVLPIAGILLGVGAAKFGIFPDVVSNIMASAGDVIFGNLPLLFAISVTLGFTKNDGVAALASMIGYGVLLASMGVMAKVLGVPTKPMMGIDTINTGVAGGIFIGAITAWLYNRFFDIELPSYLGFFGGKRFVPIVTSLTAIVCGIVLAFVWPPIGQGIQAFSNWASHENPALAFTLYGIGERSLIPFGLHHILNAPFFFETGSFVNSEGKVITGEIARYLNGDPTAGNLAGGYLFKMWGLPGAALAMWHMAKPENKKKVGGIMIAAALTSFITGITEPIEFSFLFLAPFLYLAHALLSGFAFFLCIALGIKHGTTFSHGLIDFIVLSPQSTNAGYLWILGPLWACLYYFVFRFTIKKFNLKTPGREDEAEITESVASSSTDTNYIEQLIQALGGQGNIKNLDACITRLRVQLFNNQGLQESTFKKLGASGVLFVGDGVQIILGPRSENIKTQMENYIKLNQLKSSQPKLSSQVHEVNYLNLIGGKDNIENIQIVSNTRVRIAVKNIKLVLQAELKEASAHQGFVTEVYSGNIVHIVAGNKASELFNEFQ
jgi:glucose PTS system EIICB or EIICBA component